MPRVDGLIDWLSRAKYISTIDLTGKSLCAPRKLERKQYLPHPLVYITLLWCHLDCRVHPSNGWWYMDLKILLQHIWMTSWSTVTPGKSTFNTSIQCFNVTNLHVILPVSGSPSRWWNRSSHRSNLKDTTGILSRSPLPPVVGPAEGEQPPIIEVEPCSSILYLSPCINCTIKLLECFTLTLTSVPIILEAQ